MFNLFLALSVSGVYCIATLAIILMLMGKLSRKASLSISFVAIAAHAFLLYRWIDLLVGQNLIVGQNLTFLNMLSFVTWLIGLITLLTALRKPIENLLLIIFPLSLFSIFLALLFPRVELINTAADPKQLVHVLLTAITLSVLCIAGLQAILLTFQEHRLRDKNKRKLLTQLPPLESMENLLFQSVTIGFVLLTLVIITSLYFFHDRLTLLLLKKTLLAVIAWIIFGILVLGRYHFGWRGKKAIYGTLMGVALLILIYFGSFYLLEALA